MSPIVARAAPAAFTLIELLVVIAIISILAGILFPVFAQAREKARQTQCVSNVRQFGMAAMMYAQDYDECLPLYSYGDSLHYWSGARPSSPGALDPTQGLLYPYVKSGSLQKCPSYIGGNNLGGMGYGYNGQLIALPSVTLAMLSTPSQTILYGDSGIVNFAFGAGSTKNGVNETIEIDPPALWGNSPSIDFRHLKIADFVFADGHAKAMQHDLFLQSLPAASQKRATNPPVLVLGDSLMARQ